MSEEQFWFIIEAGGHALTADPQRQLAAIREELVKLAPEQIPAFQLWLNRKLADAYTWALWAAAYLINGGCSDDGFHYFREWLISRGRAVYEAAVADPDSLAGLTDPERDDYELEDLGYLPLEVLKSLTGRELSPAEFPWPAEPKGEVWSSAADDKEIARRLPRLAGIYLD